MNQREIEYQLESFFNAETDLQVAFLFGSYARGRAGADSDVDLALLYHRDQVPQPEDRLLLREKLSRLLNKDVDLVFLNQANPIIRHQVLKYGQRIFMRSKQLYNDFFVRSLFDYDDLKRVRKIQEEKILKGRIHG